MTLAFRGDRINTNVSFGRLAFSAARLEALVYGAGLGLKLLSTLILSRLLFPEAFGLAVTVGLVSTGLIMLSNVGVTQSIIQSPNGDKLEFLNTGWTVLAARGGALWLVSVLLAYPLSWALNEPELLLLLPVGCLNVLISGLSSTALITLRRRLQLRPVLALEVVSQLVTFLLNIALALLFKSVWGLIFSSLVGALLSTFVSHLVKVGYKNRFCWHAPSWSEMYAYGRWVQASSAMSFVSSQADRFLLAHYIGMASLGVYNFATIMAEAISAGVIRVTHGVLFPLFSQINREFPTELNRRFYRIRFKIDVLTLLPLGLIAASSHQIVDLLFDPRYADAGWMLQALCVRAAMTSLLAPIETYLFSVGHTKYGFFRDVARAIWVLPGIPLAWSLGGLESVVWVVALSELPVAAVLLYAFRRHGYVRWWREAVGPLAFLIGAVVGGLFWREVSSALI